MTGSQGTCANAGRLTRFILAGLIAAAVSGCAAGSGPKPGFGGWKPDVVDVKRPQAARSRLGAGDKVAIQVAADAETFPNPDEIDENGQVTLRYLGRIRIGGMTAAEAEREMEKRYIEGGIFNNVKVTVIKEADAFFVRGEVRGPGKYELTSKTTLMKAIAQAGGFTDYAWRSNVQLRGKSYDTDKIQKGKTEDPAVKSGDIIFVPQWPW